MAYGRQAVMDALRDAGARLNNFDQMYADKVKSAVYGDDPRGAKGWVGDFLGGRYNDVEVNSELLKQIEVKFDKDFFNIVPTRNEAVDMVYMEEQERSLFS